MSNPLMTPDTAWVLGSALGAFITTGPAYIAARRSDRKVNSVGHAEHAATRAAMVDALNAVVGPLNGRLDEMHAAISDMRDWQADHATQHAIDAINRTARIEYREGS